MPTPINERVDELDSRSPEKTARVRLKVAELELDLELEDDNARDAFHRLALAAAALIARGEGDA